MTAKTVFNKPARIWAIFGYGLYTLVLLLAFSYWMFPYDRLQVWLENQLQQKTGIEILSQDRGAGPFWLVWRNARFRMPQNDVVKNIEWPRIFFEWHPFTLLNQNLQLSSHLALLDGEGRGTLNLGLLSLAPQNHLTHSFSRLDMSPLNLPLLRQGRATGTLTFRWQGPHHFAGDGEFALTLSNFTITPPPGMPQKLPSLKFSSLSGTLTLQERQLLLQGFQLTGEDLTVSGQATLSFQRNFRESQLEGSGTLSLGATLFQQFPQLGFLNLAPDQPFPITISGTLARPSVRIHNSPIPVKFDAGTIDRLAPYVALRLKQLNASEK